MISPPISPRSTPLGARASRPKFLVIPAKPRAARREPGSRIAEIECGDSGSRVSAFGLARDDGDHCAQ